LSVPNFYDIWAKEGKEIELSSRIKDLVDVTKSFRNIPFTALTDVQRKVIKQLNRLLLEVIYLEACPQYIVPCYQARGLVDGMGERTGLFKPEARSDKINLLNPRENGYRAMHTYGSLPGEGIFMIGYTTEEFDLYNRFGPIVARGKISNFAEGWAKADPLWLRRLRDLIRKEGWLTVKEIRDKIPKIASPIRVFTPEGEGVEMEDDSTALDLALMRGHINIGSIYVNGEKVEHDRILKPNDVVEVRTQEGSRPHPGWLLAVNNHESAGKIRKFLRNLAKGEEDWREIGKETLDDALAENFLCWSDVEEKEEVKEVLKYLSNIYRERIDELFEKEIPGYEKFVGEELTPKTIEILIGLGEIDVQDFRNKFNEVFQASMKKWEEIAHKMSFAILFKVERDRVGLLEEYTGYLGKIGINIIKNGSAANKDGSATLANVFEIYSTDQQLQIQNIVERRIKGEIVGSLRTMKDAREFELTKWTEEYEIVI
ncbi:MAG: hypothetical protein V3T21_03540, partial [Candidatus Margulisiibacteriota bacterium]